VPNLPLLCIAGLLHLLLLAALSASAGLPMANLLRCTCAFLVIYVIPFFPLAAWLGRTRRGAAALSLPVGVVFGTFILWTASFFGALPDAAVLLALAGLPAAVLWRRAALRFLRESSASVAAICALSLFACVVTVVPTFGDALPGPGGGVTFHTQDATFHLAVIKQCLVSPMPVQPNLASAPLRYHFFMHAFAAQLSYFADVAPEIVMGSFCRFISTIAVVVGAFVFGLELLGRPARAAAAVVILFAAHGLHTAWYWWLAMRGGILPGDPVFFHPIHGIRQTAILFLFGAHFVQCVVFAFLGGMRSDLDGRRALTLGLLLGLAVGFHIPIVAHLIASLGLIAAAVWFRYRSAAHLIAFASSAVVVGILLATGVIGEGYGGTTRVMPSIESIRFQAGWLMDGMKWWGVEIVGFGAALLPIRKPELRSEGAGIAVTAAFLGIIFQLVYVNAFKEAMISGLYFLQLPSLLLPFLLVLVLGEIRNRGGIGKPIVLLAGVLVAIQLCAGILNIAGIRACDGVGLRYGPEIVRPLNALAHEASQKNQRVATNSGFSENPLLRDNPVVSAFTGKAVLLEGITFGNPVKRPGSEIVIEAARGIAEGDRDAIVREHVGWFVEFRDGPAWPDSAVEAFPLIASSPEVRVFKTDSSR
jgi:hypothetical protein